MRPEDLQILVKRVAELEAKLGTPKYGRDGRDGRDGTDGAPGQRGQGGERGERGMPGIRGADGASGRDGINGKDGAHGLSGRDGVNGLNGRDGKDGEKGLRGMPGIDGKDGARGPRGPEGPRGEDGDIGPMPQHEWDGARLRFEQEPGMWGEWHDLRGPRGASAGGGGLVIDTKGLALDGGSAVNNSDLDGGFASDELPGIPGVGGGAAATTYSGAAFNAGRA